MYRIAEQANTQIMEPGVSIYDLAGLDRLQREQRLDVHSVRRLRNDWLKKFFEDEVALRDFPAADHIYRSGMTVYRRIDSCVDGASKLLLRTPLGYLIEAVILRVASGRVTVCVSSQVGCAAGCAFCATAKMGIARNLSAVDILDQVLRAGQILTTEKRVMRNIVFMGMGEPFHNEKNLHQALHALTCPKLFHHSPAKILISTVGVPDAMLRCALHFPKVNLALSLHSVRQSVRESLMPLSKTHSLEELRAAVIELNRRFNKRVMIEYLMLAGVNDSTDDCRELVAWLDGLDVHVNLIPFNTIEDAPHLIGSNRAARESFAAELKAHGLTTTLRHSLGSDIAAACGQLVRRENRQLPVLTVSH